MATLHIALTDLPDDLRQRITAMRDGDRLAIEGGERTMAFTKTPSTGTTIAQVISGLRAIEAKRGAPVMMDEDFAADMREIVANRTPGRGDPWA